nr:type II toxin-antitoxin system HicB family antitoxin [Streptococcus lutetiensis]
MFKTYPAIFHKESNGSYWVEFPEFAGGTQGDNLEEARINAKEFLSGILETYQIEKLPLPKPSELEKISSYDGQVELVKV